jgi:hypothetical protein
MKIHDWKNGEINRLLMEKWGLAEKKGELPPGLKAYQKNKKGAEDEPEVEGEAPAAEELEERRRRDDDDQSWSYRDSSAGGATPQADRERGSSRYDKDWHKKKKKDREEVARKIRSQKSEGLEEDCPPAELPAQGMDAAAPESEALTADDITDLQNLLDKLSNTLASDSGMELAGAEAPSEEEDPVVMKEEDDDAGDDLRETIRRALQKLREQSKI